MSHLVFILLKLVVKTLVKITLLKYIFDGFNRIAPLVVLVPIDVERVPGHPLSRGGFVRDGVASGAAHYRVLVRLGEGRAALHQARPGLGVEGLVAGDALARPGAEFRSLRRRNKGIHLQLELSNWIELHRDSE